MKVAVIGAGPAGLTAAYQLTKKGVNVEVFEASNAIGGMAKSIKLWNQKVDLGPHRFFSNDVCVNRLWLEVVQRDYKMVERLTRIYYNKCYFHYPLSPGNAFWNMGLIDATRCISSFFLEKVSQSKYSGNEADTFQSWVVGRFGQQLFEMFFKTYSEKLWGIPCKDIDADFAAQRIKKLDLNEVIKNAFGLGNGKHKTLVEQFAYPVDGSGMVYERMGQSIKNKGGKVHLMCPVRKILHENKEVTGVELENGQNMFFDHVVSTMPLTLMVRGLGKIPNEVEEAINILTYRNTVIVYLHIQGTELFPDQWLYIHSPDLLVGRVTNFRNWVPTLYGAADTTILALEYWCYDHDNLWSEDDEDLSNRAVREIQATGLIGSAPVLDTCVIRIPRCYPVYTKGYKNYLNHIINYLKRFKGLTPIGRYGAFKYNNQDHSILMGILSAENIIGEKDHDLWSINTDYESYQESAVITETGLVPA